jgi:hypothetical protein
LPRKYRLTRPARPIDRPGQHRPTACIWVDSAAEEDDGPLRLEGDERLLEQIREAIFNSYGMRGRPLDGAMSPLDLAVALDGKFLRPFEPTELSP